MKNILTVSRAIRGLERVLLPEPPKDKGPNVDYELFTEKERDIGDTIHLFHDVAVRLGYGTFSACKYKIHGFSQHYEEDRLEALQNMTPEELARVDLEYEIYGKWIKLTPLLTEDEKAAIKQYNGLARRDKYSKPPYSGTMVKAPNPEELKEAKMLYEQIMAKYDAESYEDHALGPYKAGSGIPIEQLRKMDSTYADALEAKLH